MHMTYKTMQKGTARIALSCLTLLGAMLPVACVYEQIPEAYDEADTYIHLNLISSETNTRGVSDERQGTLDENTITSLRVWAFDVDSKSVGGTAPCYKEETALNATTGLHAFTMKLPRMTGGPPLKKIDLYILANAGMSAITSPICARPTRRCPGCYEEGSCQDSAQSECRGRRLHRGNTHVPHGEL